MNDTLVIEDGVIPRRVRRPVDLVRMFGAILAIVLIVIAATVLLNSISGIDRDVADTAAKLPAFYALTLGFVSGLGQLLLPFTIAVDLLSKNRVLLLAEAIAAAALASVIAVGLNYAAAKFGGNDLWLAVAGTKDRSVTPLQVVLSAVFAYLTVARLRGWVAQLAAVVMVSTLAANAISGGHTFGAQMIAVLVGYAVGLGFRYGFGTPTVRPRGLAIANLLTEAGLPVTVLRATASTRHGRRYLASTTDNRKLQVVVFDRDLEGAGVFPRWWRSLRLRDVDALGGWKMKEAIDRNALMARAAEAAGAPVPQLLLVRALGPDACVLASEWIEGTIFSELDEVTDADMRESWRALMQLHASGVAHRALAPQHLLRDSSDKVWVLHTSSGAVAMSDLQERLDIANMLVTLSVKNTPEHVIEIARQEIGDTKLMHSLPALQPFALTRETRKSLRGTKDVLGKLREQVAALSQGQVLPRVEIERLSPRKMLTIFAGLIAAYLLVGQFSQVNLLDLFREAQGVWVFWAAVGSAITFVGATLTLDGFVAKRVSLWRTFLAQLAASFATLVSPPAVGTVAINGRFLQREGLSAATAGATVAVSQAVGLFMHVVFIFFVGIAAGTTESFHFDPPRSAVIGGTVALLVALLVLPIPKVRDFIRRTARPHFDEVLPQFVQVASRPFKLGESLLGMIVLNFGFCFSLIASVRAFGGGGTWAAISIVYLAGSALGAAAPTPGGVGAMEAVLTAGLVTAGVHAGAALPAVLLYRIMTFWLPTVPGWFALRHLTNRGSL